MTPNKWFILCGIAFMALAETSWGQKASNWRVYRVADGLPESACIAVTVSPKGRVLVKHPNQASVSVLDGFNTYVIPSSETVPGRVYESPAGQLWTVSSEGLQEFKEGAWVLHPVPEIAAEFRSGLPHLTHPIPLYPVKQGHVLFLLPDRLMEFNVEDPGHPRLQTLRGAAQTQLGKFTGMTIARDGGLWIAGMRGLAKLPGPGRNLKADTEWREYIPPGSLEIQNFQEPQEDVEGGVTVLAESSSGGEKKIVCFETQHWTELSVGDEKIRYAWRGPDKTLWAVTRNTLFEANVEGTELVENEEISARNYFDLAIDSSGTFWLATGDGLFHYMPSIWRSPPSVRNVNALVHCLTEDTEGRRWFVSGGALHMFQNDRHQEYPLPGMSARGSQTVRALLPLKNGMLLLGMEDQSFQFHPDSGVFMAAFPTNDGSRINLLGTLRDGDVCLQSFNAGVFEKDYRLEIYDGVNFRPFPNPPPNLGALGNLSVLFTAQNGDLWFSGDHGVLWYHEKKWQTFASTNTTTPEVTHCFAEMTDGKIWCGAQDKIWQFDGQKWSVVRDGLDRVNAMLRSRDGSIWIASNGGLHRFFQGTWIQNGMEEGLPSTDVREVVEDLRGRIWAATTHGLSEYHPEADPDPPLTSIQKLGDKEDNLREGENITLTFGGHDKWKFTPRDRLLYSYRLDEREWSSFDETNSASFFDLPAGKHYFQARAMDRNGNVDPQPARLEFTVALPWYKETRLVLISSAGLAVTLFFAGLAFNRHRRLLRSYAEVEKKVAERTRELEVANRELLHSQKMKALGTLAAGIAHDFNNILSIVKGSAQIIEDNLDNPQKIRLRVDRVKTVVDQGAGIVKAMLGYSRGSDEQLSLCDLNAVVGETIKLLGDRFLREVEIKVERAPDLPEVPGSKGFIQQILLNFIFNAAESMTERKRIFVVTHRLDKLPPELVLVPGQAATYVSVSVKDFGCGIPPENMPRIFDPFFTTKALSVRRGTGLGLSMVYELAKKIEAGLAVESVVDQGSTFTLILPVRDLPADAKPETVNSV